LPAPTISTGLWKIWEQSKTAGQADKPAEQPPGQSISDDLERQTARFIDEVKELAKRRKMRAAEERHGPPKPDDDQRSRRR
jgi:hypothetical protein